MASALSDTEVRRGFHPCQPTVSSVEDHRPESRKTHPTKIATNCSELDNIKQSFFTINQSLNSISGSECSQDLISISTVV